MLVKRWLEAAHEAGRIYDIDDPYILQRAEKNVPRRRQKIRVVDAESKSIEDKSADRTVIVSAIPSQKSRGWSQFNMSKQFYTDYFGFEVTSTSRGPRPAGSHRVLLNSVNEDGTLNPTESRGGVVVGSSNYRIELDAARNVHVRDGGFPMVAFAKTGSRSYLYQVFGTDDLYHSKLVEFARKSNARLKANEHPKCWVSEDELKSAIPDMPLLHVEESFNE